MAGCIKSGFIRKKSLCCQKPQPQPELSSTLWVYCCADESSSVGSTMQAILHNTDLPSALTASLPAGVFALLYLRRQLAGF
jgi:hypothetical protein